MQSGVESSQDRARAAQEMESLPESFEVPESLPDVPDQAAFESFSAERLRLVDEAAKAVVAGGEQRIQKNVDNIGLESDEVSAVRQETGVDASLDRIQGEVTSLQEATQTEIEEMVDGALQEMPGEGEEPPEEVMEISDEDIITDEEPAPTAPETPPPLPVPGLARETKKAPRAWEDVSERELEEVVDQSLQEESGETGPELPDPALFESLDEIREEMAQEQDRDKLIDIRSKAVDLIRQSLPELTDENAAAYIKEFNEKNAGALQGLELSLLRGRGDRLLIVDESGGLREIEVSKENSGEALQEVKELDEQLERRGNSYELRHEILRRSEGKLTSHDAYTYGTEPVADKDLDAFLDDPESWVPERRRLHEQIVEQEVQKALDLSDRMESPNSVFALRGNTASGKTTNLKEHPLFSKAINPETGNPDGAINPDTYKEGLKSAESDRDSWQNVTHYQTHEEGSMLSRAVSNRIENTAEASMIIDKRLNKAKNVNELVELAERSGKSLKLLDVDAPLESSLIVVLARPPGGKDPLVPFDAVAQGFQGIRENRNDLLWKAMTNDKIDTYALYGPPGPDGEPQLIAEKRDRGLRILNMELFDQALNTEDAQAEIDRLRDTVIDDDYIERILASTPEKFRDTNRAALSKYKGKTLEQALNEHSREINEVPPSRDYYVEAAQKNLEATSRTASGVVDTSASADKAEKMAGDLTAETAAERAKQNFKEATRELFDNREASFGSPEELRDFVENIALKINGGILKEGILIRGGADSTKYPYTRVADLEKAMAQFYQELHERLQDPEEDPVKLAAWAEYRIDLSDHFFADGCGKTAKAISSWILMRAGKRLPDYSSQATGEKSARSAYYENAPREIRKEDETSDNDPQLQQFTEYYEKLVPAS
ncbi:hypothetical protein AMJ57_00935 [Parcubacteria bacterium SG8_24]|nr:MAG: hypothetical protein AMJ57_00935 [Parcubacteria bacterium SG8_24]